MYDSENYTEPCFVFFLELRTLGIPQKMFGIVNLISFSGLWPPPPLIWEIFVSEFGKNERVTCLDTRQNNVCYLHFGVNDYMRYNNNLDTHSGGYNAIYIFFISPFLPFKSATQDCKSTRRMTVIYIFHKIMIVGGFMTILRQIR